MPQFAYIEAYETGAYSRISVSWVETGISAKTKSRGRVSHLATAHPSPIFSLLFLCCRTKHLKGARRLVLILACTKLFSIFFVPILYFVCQHTKRSWKYHNFFIKDLHIHVPPSAASFFLSWTNRSSLVAILRTIEDK